MTLVCLDPEVNKNEIDVKIRFFVYSWIYFITKCVSELSVKSFCHSSLSSTKLHICTFLCFAQLMMYNFFFFNNFLLWIKRRYVYAFGQIRITMHAFITWISHHKTFLIFKPHKHKIIFGIWTKKKLNRSDQNWQSTKNFFCYDCNFFPLFHSSINTPSAPSKII